MSGPLLAHSLSEVTFFLRGASCTSCGRGPLGGGESVREEGAGAGGVTLTVETVCHECGSAAVLQFLVTAPPGEHVNAFDPPLVNPTEDPSRILDVGQWIMLSRVLTEEASAAKEKGAGRRLALQAAQCIEEALKFYEDDNDLPPPGATFTDATRRRLREAPDQFSKRRLIELRAKLPFSTAQRAAMSKDSSPQSSRGTHD